ncbi:DUF5713 family protein [Saccharibacillus sp. CPCC 101409]|uniref:DUF5713 family protein n=1 Tax=Saccharibacillus sp. CPCC 101409 TaxID=3058041 RepID=UPI0026739DB8|nr:DUF5713 family protein [Saccharibacillus sp. CPCC 101409]MDO3410351.1 DUF5713 family protein [Saccharibacillus sp. CPCC 101409]
MTASIVYLQNMYRDDYYPDFLVDKIKARLEQLAQFLQAGPQDNEAVQRKLDEMTLAINEIQDEFYEHDSELETVARDCIAETTEQILQAFGVDIDLETALRERDW